jgi:predicted aspartyl protease
VGYRAAGIACCIAMVALPAGAAPGKVAAEGYALTTARGGRLLVEVRVNHVPVEALLDSAAEMSFIDPAFARRLGLSAAAATAAQGSGAAAVDAGLVPGVRLEAFGLTLTDQTLAITDLADVGARLLHRRLDMILGREVFDAARLQIDIPHQRLLVVSAAREPRGVRLALTTQRGIETFGVRLEGGAPVQAALDLGNGSQVLVGAALAARLNLLHDGREVRRAAGGGLGGAQQRQLITLRSLEVAGCSFSAVPAAIDAKPSATDLNLGVSILRHFVITTDFAQHLVWLEPAGARKCRPVRDGAPG